MENSSSVQHLYTLASLTQFPGIFKGTFFKGHPEPRIAFLGRSNVGKSSLLNALLQTKIAYTSQYPGKTAALQFFSWPKAKKILVDLPGYGFAKTSTENRKNWEALITQYLTSDPGLEKLLLLIDTRRGVMPLDEEAIHFLKPLGISISLVFTKIDELKNQSQQASQKKKILEQLQKLSLPISPEIFWTSVQTKRGVVDLMKSLQLKSSLKRS